MLKISCRLPLQEFWCPCETINIKSLLFFSIRLWWVSSKKSIWFGCCHAHLEEFCITVLCNNILPKMYQIILKTYFLAINGKKKKIIVVKKKKLYSAVHILDKLGEEASMWFILLHRADCKAILISLSGRGDEAQSIQMEVVVLRFLFNSNEKWQRSYCCPYRKMYRLLHFTLG